MLDCLLFDLDGLLVDSEPLQFRAYQQAFAEYGIGLDMEGWICWHGTEASASRFVRDKGLEIDAEAVRALKKTIYDQLVADELALKPGVENLVESCARRFDLAVVSGSRRESIEGCLRKFGLQGHFREFISGTELAHSKPYPDPYLEALRLMQRTAATTLALEDSATGFAAARAAGIACVVCPDHFMPKPADVFAGAALVVESLDALDPDTLHAAHATATSG